MKAAEAPIGGRVALVVPTFPKRSETFIVRHLVGLLARGVDAHVVCRASPGVAWRELPELAGIDRAALRRRVHVDWPVDRRAAVLMPLQLARCVLRRPWRTAVYFARALRRHGPLAALRRLYLDAELLLLAPTLVHVEFGALALGREDLGRLLGARLVVSFRGYDLNLVGREAAMRHRGEPYRRLWRMADGVHVLSRALHAVARARGLGEDVPVALIPPAVDARRWTVAPRAARRASAPALHVVSVGRLVWQKGLEYGLRALSLLVERGVDARWTLVGDGPALEELAFGRHRLGLDDRVELVGGVPPDAVAEYLAAADVYFHPAVTEGFCNAVLEAQAAGVAVVASNAGGLPENVADGETGLIVPRREPRAAADALERLARDPALRRRMGAAGRERAETFTLGREIDGFLALYRLAAERVAA